MGMDQTIKEVFNNFLDFLKNNTKPTSLKDLQRIEDILNNKTVKELDPIEIKELIDIGFNFYFSNKKSFKYYFQDQMIKEILFSNIKLTSKHGQLSLDDEYFKEGLPLSLKEVFYTYRQTINVSIYEKLKQFLKENKSSEVKEFFVILGGNLNLDNVNKAECKQIVLSFLKDEKTFSNKKMALYTNFLKIKLFEYFKKDFETYYSLTKEDEEFFVLFDEINEKNSYVYDFDLVFLKNKIHRDKWFYNDTCINQEVVNKYLSFDIVEKNIVETDNSLSFIKNDFDIVFLWDFDLLIFLNEKLQKNGLAEFKAEVVPKGTNGVERETFFISWDLSDHVKDNPNVINEVKNILKTVLKSMSQLPKKEIDEYAHEISSSLREINLRHKFKESENKRIKAKI